MTVMGQLIELRAHGLALSIECSEFTEDHLTTCHVSVEVPGFLGAFFCDLWRPDLKSFRSQLRAMIGKVGREASASLVGTEPGIDLNFKLNVYGRIDGRYTLCNFDAPGSAVLSGDFAMDQSYLPPLLTQVESILTAADRE